MPAKSIMIQGTMSNAGKSLLAAGLCRIFRQDGYRVAPFKSQNMALNSFITREGLEMGRAQVVQAEACGIEPSVRMNPILLKPTTDMGSQVIIMGEPVGNMEARTYFRNKKQYLPVIRNAYESLAAEHDIIVIEGAGSPAEINLKADDIVNMGMARIADAPVLLVGDIDRGGVFAQLLGTVLLLEPEEQDRIIGLIINKFRGDPDILKPGLAMLEEKVGKPVLGVVPYANVKIEEEDSLAEELSVTDRHAPIDIAVIRLPKISNFTDFEMLSQEEMISVRYVTDTAKLGHPDCVILPGTKSTISDLLWLRESGLEALILHLHDNGTPVIGICGGYQMLGKTVSDPHGMEGGGIVRGMHLLPVNTVFTESKTMRQSAGRTVLGQIPELSGVRVSGYEVHMGVTTLDESTGVSDAESFLNLGTVNQADAVEGGEQEKATLTSSTDRSAHRKENAFREEKVHSDGFVSGHVLGTYLHGLFDEAEFRGAFLRWLAGKKGISVEGGAESYRDFKEKQYDLLADTLRSSLDLASIYRAMGIVRN